MIHFNEIYAIMWLSRGYTKIRVFNREKNGKFMCSENDLVARRNKNKKMAKHKQQNDVIK